MIRPASIFTALAIFCCVTPAEAQWPWSKPRPKPTPVPVVKATPAPVKKTAAPVIPPRARPEPTPMIALPNYDEETSTRLQIFLDNNNFGPGKIDGEMGEFFRKALVAYKKANGMEVTGAVDQSFLEQVPQAFTEYTIPPEALNFVGPVSGKPSEQAKLKGLKYGSLLEFICERYHAAEAFVRKINPGMNLEQLKPATRQGAEREPFEIEHLRKASCPEKPALAGRKIVIDTYERFWRSTRTARSSRVPDHPWLKRRCRAGRHLEDSRHRNAPMVPPRRRAS
jgi:hypothetical protein